MTAEEKVPLFVYGTLLIPEILETVLRHPLVGVTYQEGELFGYTRLAVKNEDYPALVNSVVAVSVLGRPLVGDELKIDGSLVYGLKACDIKMLDEFEGEEYSPRTARVKNLNSGEQVLSHIYEWADASSRLSQEFWSFEQFKRDKSVFWIATGNTDDEGEEEENE